MRILVWRGNMKEYKKKELTNDKKIIKIKFKSKKEVIEKDGTGGNSNIIRKKIP